MSKKRGRDRSSILGNASPNSQPSLEEQVEIDRAIYGGETDFSFIDGDRRVIEPINIFSIQPNWTQPRRILPSQIRTKWNGNPVVALEYWIELVAEKRDVTPEDIVITVDYHIRSEAEEPEQAVSPLESNWWALVALASSIRSDGLTNPITVAQRSSSEYEIETGERRWLAYHLLAWWAEHYAADEAGQWHKIPAHVVLEIDIWRQAGENNARSDLNAIGRARQFALLLMAIYTEKGQKFKPLDSFKHERDFYAQVHDGEKWRIPRGAGGRIADSMGVKSSDVLRQYRLLLSTPADAWTYADDHDESINAIVAALQNPNPLQALRGSVNALTVRASGNAEEWGFETGQIKKQRKGFNLALKLTPEKIQELSAEQREKHLENLEAARQRLERILEALQADTVDQ